MAVRTSRVLLDADQVARTLRRIAHEIVEREGELLADAALVGIYTRGVVLAQRLRRLIAEISGVELPVGALDITFYRDDVGLRGGETPGAQPADRQGLAPRLPARRREA